MLAPLAGMGILLDRAYYPQDGALYLQRYLDALHRAFVAIAENPSGRPPRELALLEELCDVRRTATYVKWLPGPAADADRVMKSLGGRIGELRGPAGEALAELIWKVWDWRDYRRSTRADPVLVGGIERALSRLEPSMPRLRGDLARLHRSLR